MQEKISMLKVREILRLRYEKGLSARQIGLSCNVGRQTVSNYLKLASISGINWEEDKNLNDTVCILKKRFTGARRRKTRR